MYDVEDTLWQPCFERELRQTHGSEWHTFRWFEDERVSANDRHGEHPQRDHRGKIKGSDPRTYSKRNAVRVDVDSGRDVLHCLSHLEGGGAASMLDHLKATEDIPFRVFDGFTTVAKRERNPVTKR